jgi:hypothetical protein
MTLPAGTRLGPYEILGPIGAGGMGEVYRARDARLERDIAVKVLPEDLSRDLAALTRFQREAKVLAALSHPNLLGILDVGREGNVVHAVTELLEGRCVIAWPYSAPRGSEEGTYFAGSKDGVENPNGNSARRVLRIPTAACTAGSKIGSEVAAPGTPGRGPRAMVGAFGTFFGKTHHGLGDYARSATPTRPQRAIVRTSNRPVREESHMNRRSYRIPSLVTHSLLGLIMAASASAQSVRESGAQTKSLKLDHFWCYIISSETPDPAVTATLKDQFQTASDVSVGSPLQFCNPVQKTVGTTVTPIVNLNDHLTMYNLQTSAPLPASQTLTATNQFGAQQLTVDNAATLMVPTQKMLENLRFPTKLDHFLCYPVNAASIAQPVSLTDQFQTADVTVEQPVLFCNPVAKTIGNKTTRIQNPAAHLLCYNIRLPQSTTSRQVPIENQLETDTFTLTTTQMLCVPSTKTLP